MSRCIFFAAFFVPDVADGCLEWDWFGSQKNDVAGCCQMLPGFIPLGESLRDPKDVLLSNSAEFVQCPDATVSKKKLEMKLATKE